MSAEKRPASDAFGSTQMVVKRPNLGNDTSKSVTRVNGSGANGALIQTVCYTIIHPAIAQLKSTLLKRASIAADGGIVFLGSADVFSSSTGNGTHRTFRGSLCSKI